MSVPLRKAIDAKGSVREPEVFEDPKNFSRKMKWWWAQLKAGTKLSHDQKIVFERYTNRYSFMQPSWGLRQIPYQTDNIFLKVFLGENFCDDMDRLLKVVRHNQKFGKSWVFFVNKLVANNEEHSDEKVFLLCFLADCSEEEMDVFKLMPTSYLYQILEGAK